jgi:transposase
MDGAAQGPAAQEHGVGVSGPVGLGRHARPHPPHALRRGPRESRTGGQSDHGHSRQPDRQGCSQRGASLDPSGYDAAKKTPGRKRHILTDTLGLLLGVSVHSASVQDRDGAEALLREARRSFPFLERIIADAGYQGRKMEAVIARTGAWELQIVRRCDRHRFVVVPKRWIVERTLAWISRCRRLARDYERHARKAAAFVRLAMIRLMLRRLAASS